MNKSDETISQLLNDVGPVVKPSHPLGIFLQWLGVTLISTGIIVAFMKPRPDLAAQFTTPLYITEVTSLALIIFTTAISAVWLCYPDLRQRPKTVLLPFAPTLLFVGLSIYRLLHPELTAPPLGKVQGIDCAMCVIVLAVAPGFWMFHLLRRHTTTYPFSAGTVSFAAAASIGLLVLKLVEPNDSVLHLVQWHFVPMVILSAIGGLLGRKFLVW